MHYVVLFFVNGMSTKSNASQAQSYSSRIVAFTFEPVATSSSRPVAQLLGYYQSSLQDGARERVLAWSGDLIAVPDVHSREKKLGAATSGHCYAATY